MSNLTLPPNRFKQALRQRRAQIGLWLGLGDPYTAELCAGSGFDWLLIDGEHGPHDLRSVLGTLQAIDSAAHHGQSRTPSHPVLRIAHGDTALIKQVLELGVDTLLVPMVETADHARELVRAMRYPPHGVRGVGSALARSSRWSAVANYANEANDRMCLLVQVETVAALHELDAILAVDGVDGVFVGPADLAASMGYHGKSDQTPVLATIDDAIRRIVAAGKAAGIIAVDEAMARHYLDLGATFVAVGVDALLLAQSTRALAARFRPAG